MGTVKKISERRTHLSFGIIIGIGMMLLILGFVQWIKDSFVLSSLITIFQEVGIDPNRHWLISTLGNDVYGDKLLMILGVAALLLGLITEVRHKENAR